MSLLRQIGAQAGRHGSAALGERDTVGRRATIPPPTRGLNTRDPLADMKPEYAVTLDNYFPDHGAVRLRAGNREYATGVGTGHVETLIEQYAGSAARFFAVGGGAVYDITTRGAAGAALKSGLTRSRWSWANIGGHIVMVSGADDPERIQTDGAFAASHGWTGLADADELETVTAFKNRLYFTRRDSPIIYYGPLNGVQGALTAFDLGYVAPEGGNAIQIGTLTVDSGAGIDDLILVFMQHGIVLLYRGIDPSSASATGFFLVGKFRIGALVGDRPLVNVGGDLFAHTVDGIASMGELLKRGRSGQKGVGVSDAIVPSIRQQAALYGDTDGWDSILHPPTSWLLFSAPANNGEQFCMNTQTGAWCRFRGMDARCWGRFRDRLYFGGPGGKVFRAGVGHADDDGPIVGDVQTAYNYLGTPQDKRITLARSVVESNAEARFSLGSTTDFGVPAQLNAPSFVTSDRAIWGEAVWGVGKWGGRPAQLRDWQAVNRVGSAISIRLSSATSGASLALYATDIVFERAPGIL